MIVLASKPNRLESSSSQWHSFESYNLFWQTHEVKVDGGGGGKKLWEDSRVKSIGRGRDEQEVNIKLRSEQNHLFLCFCFCFLALLELIPLISASKLVIVQSTAYVRLLWKACRGITSSTLPQSQPQSALLPLRDDLVSNFCPLICIYIFRGNWQCAVWLKDM